MEKRKTPFSHNQSQNRKEIKEQSQKNISKKYVNHRSTFRNPSKKHFRVDYENFFLCPKKGNGVFQIKLLFLLLAIKVSPSSNISSFVEKTNILQKKRSMKDQDNIFSFFSAENEKILNFFYSITRGNYKSNRNFFAPFSLSETNSYHPLILDGQAKYN